MRKTLLICLSFLCQSQFPQERSGISRCRWLLVGRITICTETAKLTDDLKSPFWRPLQILLNCLTTAKIISNWNSLFIRIIHILFHDLCKKGFGLVLQLSFLPNEIKISPALLELVPPAKLCLRSDCVQLLENEMRAFVFCKAHGLICFTNPRLAFVYIWLRGC